METRDILLLKSYGISTETICISMWQKKISGIPSSWPGYDLDIGASGSKVLQLQEQLNAISQAYPALPKVNPDGIYGAQTQASVRKFQNIFGLPETGIVDYTTWYKIQEIYVGVTRIAELQ